MHHVVIGMPQQGFRENADGWTNLLSLSQARYDARRLASFRRVLGTLIIVLGTPVVVLSCCFTDPTVRHVLTILAFAWLALFLPMVRLLWVEWQNRRLVDDLYALVYGGRER